MSRYYEDEPCPRKPSSAPVVVSLTIMTIALVALIAALWPDLARTGDTLRTGALGEHGVSGAIGNQAPPHQLDRSGASPAADQDAPAAQPSIDQYNASETAKLNALQGAPAAEPVVAPLPLNSAGEPVISREQQAQLDQSAQMAADEQQAALRAAADADAQSRAPDVSYADAAAELHRDPCHVPRANPATCALGLFKPTPVR
jgi:hypothetical protein